MPPTRTRAATSAEVRPVRIATDHAVGPHGGDAGQATQGAPGERHDSRGRRVARALGQRPVEVAHDEQAPRPRPAGRSRDRGVPSSRTAAPGRRVKA